MKESSVLLKSNILKIGQKSNPINIDFKSSTNYPNNIIFGFVYNDRYYNNYIGGATIKLQDVNDKFYFDTITNMYGQYLFFNIPNSTYYYTVEYNNKFILKRKIEINNYLINNYDVCLNIYKIN